MTHKSVSNISQTALLRSPEPTAGNDSAWDPAWMYHVATTGRELQVPLPSEPPNENFCKPKWHKVKEQLLLIEMENFFEYSRTQNSVHAQCLYFVHYNQDA